MKQLTFEKNNAFQDHKERFEHGGGIREKKRKLSRPFDRHKCLHITLRSTRAKGAWSFLKRGHEEKIQRLIYRYGDRFHVRVMRYANAGNHLHILIKAKSKKGFQRYLRTIAGIIPRVITKAKKGRTVGRFWDNLAYSKLVSWGRQFKNTSNYILKNTLEAFGIILLNRMQ